MNFVLHVEYLVFHLIDVTVLAGELRDLLSLLLDVEVQVLITKCMVGDFLLSDVHAMLLVLLEGSVGVRRCSEVSFLRIGTQGRRR